MAVTKEQFEAMPQVAYSEARPLIRTGDILLFHASGFGPDVIELFTRSLWCHAAFVWNIDHVDRILLLESVDTYGVRAAPMSTRINGSKASPKPFEGKLLLVRHDDFPPPPNSDQVRAMTRFALDRLGYPYSMAEIEQIALRIAAGMAGKTLPGRIDFDSQFICSEYVAKCYQDLGILLAPDKEGFLAPADIADDPKIRPVLSIRHD